MPLATAFIATRSCFLAVFGFLFAGALLAGKKMKKKNTGDKPFPPAAEEEDESRYLN